MVERMNPALPISQQCGLLALPRSSVYRKPAEVSAQDLAIMARIDRHYLARPYYGSRRMAAWLATRGHRVNRKRVQRLMRLLGLAAIYQRPNKSKPAAAHKIYPYLLRGLAIERVNQSLGYRTPRQIYQEGLWICGRSALPTGCASPASRASAEGGKMPPFAHIPTGTTANKAMHIDDSKSRGVAPAAAPTMIG